MLEKEAEYDCTYKSSTLENHPLIIIGISLSIIHSIPHLLLVSIGGRNGRPFLVLGFSCALGFTRVRDAHDSLGALWHQGEEQGLNPILGTAGGRTP